MTIGRRLSVAATALVIAATAVAPAPPALGQTPVAGLPRPNNDVHAVEIVGDVLYMGGSFDHVGTYSENGIVVGVDVDELLPGFPAVRGAVWTAEPDGEGGWYIGGHFQGVGGVARNGAARIRADGSLTSWNPNAGIYGPGYVISILRDAGVVYIGGYFESIGTRPRRNLAAVDAQTGAVLPWNPNVNSTIYDMAISDGLLYIGGAFSRVGVRVRQRLAAIDLATGVAVDWRVPGSIPNGSVYSLAIQDERVYIGGSFTTFGGVSRSRLAAADKATGEVLSWNPNSNGTVRSLVSSAGGIYAAGDFTQIGGISRSRVALLNADTGMVQPWNPNANGSVHSLAISGTDVYLGGDFSTLGGQPRQRAGKVNLATGAPLDWNPRPDRVVRTVAPSFDSVFLGGDFTLAHADPRSAAAAIDLSGGFVLPWNPNVTESGTGTVYALDVADSLVYLGGRFTSVGGQIRIRLAAVSATTGAVTPFNPNVNSTVERVQVIDEVVVVSGVFGTISGQPRKYIAAIDRTTSVPLPWDLAPNENVTAFAARDSIAYVAGEFTTIGGSPRNRLAAFNFRTGALTDWNPNASGGVESLALADSTVYISGAFATIGGVSRNELSAVHASSGAPLGWDPGDMLTAPETLEIDGPWMFAGSSYWPLVPGSPPRHLISIDLASAEISNWIPTITTGYDNGVHALSSAGQFLVAGGGFAERLATWTSEALHVDVQTPAFGEVRLAASRNPARWPASLQLTLPTPRVVTVRVVDVTGRRVATLLDRRSMTAGTHRLDFSDAVLAPGVYFAVLSADGVEESIKFTVLR